MEKRELEELVTRLKNTYTEIKRHFTNVQKPSCSISDLALCRFIKTVETKYYAVVPERLADICIATAYRLKDKKHNAVTFFAPSMISKYAEDDYACRQFQDDWLREGGLCREDIVDLLRDRSEPYMVRFVETPWEDMTKRRLHNRYSGFMLCQQSTLGWAPASEQCRTCVYADDCQKETAKRHPELYQLRKQSIQQ